MSPRVVAGISSVSLLRTEAGAAVTLSNRVRNPHASLVFHRLICLLRMGTVLHEKPSKSFLHTAIDNDA